MTRSELAARIATADAELVSAARQLACLREELAKEDKQRYFLDEMRHQYTGKLKAAVIRDRKAVYPGAAGGPSRHFPVATVDRVGSLTEEEVLAAASQLLAMYRSSER